MMSVEQKVLDNPNGEENNVTITVEYQEIINIYVAKFLIFVIRCLPQDCFEFLTLGTFNCDFIFSNKS